MEKSAGTSRFSPVAASWLVALGFVGLLVLLFWPAPEEPPPPPPPVNARPPSALTKVGLPDDPDLEGLPGFFAVWADSAEWKDNTTIFAYRHPVSGEFMFFFEATRTSEGFRFRPIKRPADVPLRELGPDIPIAFFRPDIVDPTSVRRVQEILRNSPPAPKVDVDLAAPKASAPALEPPK